MARVRFLPAQRAHTGGVSEVELPGADFQSLAGAIRARFPDFPAEELERCTIALDGEIVQRPLLEPLAPDSEVIFVTRLGAG